MTASWVVGMYLLTGCALASWAWLSYAREETSGKYTPAMNALIFLIYVFLWPIGAWKDRRRFF